MPLRLRGLRAFMPSNFMMPSGFRALIFTRLNCAPLSVIESPIKGTHREKASSNKIPALTKFTIIGI